MALIFIIMIILIMIKMYKRIKINYDDDNNKS